MVWLEVLVVGQLLFALLFLNSGFVCSYFTVFFFLFSFFLKNRQLCLSVRYVVIRGAGI